MKTHSPPNKAQRAVVCCASLLLAQAAWAQVPLQAEFRIDRSTAQPLSLVATNLRTDYREGTFTVNVGTSNLSIGPHWLEVRMQGTNNVWSAWHGQWFRVSGSTWLTAAEWFVDSDPGAGNGTAIPLPVDGAWDEATENMVVTNVSVTSLSVGSHNLVIRAKDSNGDWGPTSQTGFWVADPVYIAGAEWTPDPYASAGTGYAMQAQDGVFDSAQEDVIATPNSALAGTNWCVTNTLYVRVKDSLGRWSSRAGYSWNAASNTWVFDPNLGWSDASKGYLKLLPEVPSSPTPASGGLTTNRSPRLIWASSPGATSYQVTFWQQGGSPAAYTGVLQSWFDVPARLARYTPTYWIVRALVAADCYTDGPTWQFIVPNPGDNDGDRMPDAWEVSYFGSAAYANSTSDHDYDGQLDWQEYVAGTCPTNFLDYFKIEGRVLPGNPVKVALDWSSVTGRVYTVYGTTNLLGTGTVWNALLQVPGTGTNLSYTNSTGAASRMFFRVEVVLPDAP